MKKNKPKKKIRTLKSLKDEAWRLISIFVRTNGGKIEYNFCFTCGVRKHYKELQCGHYIHNRLDYELNNLKPQCPSCNKWKSGNLGVYGERLIKEIGLKKVDKMRLWSYKKGNNYNRQELEKIIKKYRLSTKGY
ncbi:MAG: recombination protein NinG [Nanoarchaeota archaeon]